MHQKGDNGVVRLSSASRAAPQEATRIGRKGEAVSRITASGAVSRGFSVSTNAVKSQGVSPAAARAMQARSRMSSGERVKIRPDMRSVGRILDAVVAGDDARVAAIKPASFFARLLAALLLPALFASPIAAAASEDGPISTQVAAAVAEASDPVTPSAPEASVAASDAAPAPESESVSSPTPVENAAAETPAPLPAVDTASSTASLSETPVSEPVATTSPEISVPTVDPTVVSSSSEPVSSNASSTSTATTSADIIAVSPDNIANSDATSSPLDIAPPEQRESIEEIRAQLREEMKSELANQVRSELRDSVRDEVRMEVERDVKKKAMNGCTRIPDGSGMYCIDDMNLFGSSQESNDAVSVSVAPNAITKNKEIFIARGGVTTQLTRSADDNTSPSLDSVGSLLAWQSMQSGHAQIAWSDTKDIKPVVHQLTSSENNFYPKVFAGRLAWQAWIDGNWEIVWAEPATTVLSDSELSPENKALGVDGNWVVHRITHNNVPDMFPSLSRDAITWQSVDGGVWQVFSYDIVNGKVSRVSRPGVSSETPTSAMVWTERDGDSVRLVGRSLDGGGDIDFTDAARHAGEGRKQIPTAPVNDTQMVISSTTVRMETSSSTPNVE